MGLIGNSNPRFIRAEDNYDRGNYQNKYRSDSSDRRNQYRQNRGRPRYEQIYRRGNSRGNMRIYQNFGRQNSRGEYRGNYRNEYYRRERGRSRSRERSFSKNINNRRNDRSISNSRSRSGSRASTSRDGIRCYKCRKYYHFVKDCPSSKEEREIEQIQQMFNLDEEQTSLKMLATNMYDNLNKINSLENIRQEHLNL